MGKAENIKRMKRMRQAKAKANNNTMEALEAQSIRIMSKKISGVRAHVLHNRSAVKYSDLLKELVEPIIPPKPDESTMTKILGTGIMAWNLACAKQRDIAYYNELLVDIRRHFAGIPERMAVIDFLVARKGELFPQHQQYMIDFELRQNGADAYLTVSFEPEKEVVEEYQRNAGRVV